jgi:hypothetical protein
MVFGYYTGGKRGRKHGAGTEDADSSTMTDGSSFMDNSYLRTIHSSNKKYVEGRRELQEKVPAAFAGGRSVKHKLYSSDEEEEAGLHGMLLSHLVVVCGSLYFHCRRLVYQRCFCSCLT